MASPAVAAIAAVAFSIALLVLGPLQSAASPMIALLSSRAAPPSLPVLGLGGAAPSSKRELEYRPWSPVPPAFLAPALSDTYIAGGLRGIAADLAASAAASASPSRLSASWPSTPGAPSWTTSSSRGSPRSASEAALIAGLALGLFAAGAAASSAGAAARGRRLGPRFGRSRRRGASEATTPLSALPPASGAATSAAEEKREASPEAQEEVDVAIVGAGPAGTLLAYLLAERHGLRVCVADRHAARAWPNNYGVWLEEWDALDETLRLGLRDCLDVAWEFTDCFLGGSWGMPVDKRMRIDRPYGRVDRARLKAKLQSPRVHVIEESLDTEAVAPNIFSGDALRHDGEGSTLTFASGHVVRARLVVDTTGSESRLTFRATSPGEPHVPDPGFQVAYGFECIVEGNGHYAPEAMTLFDYRTDHLSFDPEWEARARRSPTFMYAMPLGPAEDGSGGQRYFFEETSLVARPGLSLSECKRRCFARLEHLGVAMRPGSLTDEELCYIPMGGPLPARGQRLVAFGGAAAMVHPATGYHLCRMMAGSSELASAIARGLSDPGSHPDEVAAAAYDSLWSQSNQMQRDFAIFGSEFLMSLDVEELRGWFDGFFRLREHLWAGFLAGWPTLPSNEFHATWRARLMFGTRLVFKLRPMLSLRLIRGIIQHTLAYGAPLVRSVLPVPILKKPPKYEWPRQLEAGEVGDPVVKREARALLAAAAASSSSASPPPTSSPSSPALSASAAALAAAAAADGGLGAGRRMEAAMAEASATKG